MARGCINPHDSFGFLAFQLIHSILNQYSKSKLCFPSFSNQIFEICCFLLQTHEIKIRQIQIALKTLFLLLKNNVSFHMKLNYPESIGLFISLLSSSSKKCNLYSLLILHEMMRTSTLLEIPEIETVINLMSSPIKEIQYYSTSLIQIYLLSKPQNTEFLIPFGLISVSINILKHGFYITKIAVIPIISSIIRHSDNSSCALFSNERIIPNLIEIISGNLKDPNTIKQVLEIIRLINQYENENLISISKEDFLLSNGDEIISVILEEDICSQINTIAKQLLIEFGCE